MERNVHPARHLLGALAAGALALLTGSACIDTSQIRGAAGKSGTDAGQPITRDGGLPNGSSCGNGSDCRSGFCADGYCCNEACQESCHTCGPNNATTPLVA